MRFRDNVELREGFFQNLRVLVQDLHQCAHPVLVAGRELRLARLEFELAILGALCVLLTLSLPAAAQGRLNSHESIEVRASIWKAWDAVKDFDGLSNWHPMFSGSEIKSGENGEVGAIRTMTVKDGPSFDEELLSYDALDKKFGYRIIDPAPLPVSAYEATFQVTESRRGYTLIVWNSTYQNSTEGKMKDEEVIGFINGAFRVGLENLKSMLEAQ